MRRILSIAVVIAMPFAAWSDEGMWTIDNFPSVEYLKNTALISMMSGCVPRSSRLQDSRMVARVPFHLPMDWC